MKQINLQQMTIVELKALAYDTMNNLEMVNMEIRKRMSVLPRESDAQFGTDFAKNEDASKTSK
jgi:hypothetical protein